MKPYLPIETKKRIKELEEQESTNKHRLARYGKRKWKWIKHE